MRARGRQRVDPSALNALYQQTPTEIHPADIDISRTSENFRIWEMRRRLPPIGTRN